MSQCWLDIVTTELMRVYFYIFKGFYTIVGLFVFEHILPYYTWEWSLWTPWILWRSGTIERYLCMLTCLQLPFIFRGSWCFGKRLTSIFYMGSYWNFLLIILVHERIVTHSYLFVSILYDNCLCMSLFIFTFVYLFVYY